MKINHIFLPLLLVSLLIGCQPKKQPHEADISTDKTYDKTAISEKGMVAAAQPLATEAGARVLDAGGNAADAAVAVAFVLAVVEPTMNGIGGRNQILVKKSDGSYASYNGMTEVPASFVPQDDPPNSGHGTIATPGMVASMMRLHQENGRLPLSELMKPAINYAMNGFYMLEGEAIRHKMGLEAIKSDPGFRHQMMKNDSMTYEAGELLKQPDLAKTLQRISDTNGKDFYEGETARLIAEDMSKNGGFVTEEDLKNYQVPDGRRVTTNYRGYEVNSIAAPAGGGLVVKALNILAHFELSELSDAQWAAVVNQAIALAVRSMEHDYHEKDLALVQSKAWAAKQANEIKVPMKEADETAAHLSVKNQQLLAANTDWSGNTWGNDSHHTTHFVTADCDGMVVSITQTIGPLFGSKVITPGLGFVYASTMGAYLSGSDQAPGSRPRTTIAPTILTKDGETVLVLGAAGGLRILSGIVQTISRYVDQGKSLEEAVSAPRVHPGTNFKDGKREVFLSKFSAEYTVENGWAPADSIYWTEEGFEVKAITRYGAFARVHAIAKDTASGQWIGMADLDWEGTAEAPIKSECED